MFEIIQQMDFWTCAIIIYIFLAIISLVPTILAIFKRIELHDNVDSFKESPHFSELGKKRLNQHYSRIKGTLGFWKNEAAKYKTFHYYCLCWTIPVSVLIPIIAQFIDGYSLSKLFLTIISSHVAILLAFYKGFKVDTNYKIFRHGESEFYDLYRRFNPLHKPLKKQHRITLQLAKAISYHPAT